MILAINLGGTHAACTIVQGGRILAGKTIAADRESRFESLLPVRHDALAESLNQVRLDASACSAISLRTALLGPNAALFGAIALAEYRL